MPAGWTSGHDVVCSVECFRVLYAGGVVAHLFPAQATDEEHEDLRRFEDEVIDRLRTSSPRAFGYGCGKIFRVREERESARRGGPSG